MTRLFFSTFIAASLCAPVLAAAQDPAAPPASTIQASTNLVVVDVVVTDSKHNPLHNLATSDFTVLENGQAQSIKTLEEHHSWEAAAPLPQPPRLPPGTFTNYTNVPASGALNILLLDSLNTPITAQADVRNQMLKYLKEARPGTRMAIFGLTTRLILLQGFSTDPDLLSDVLNGKKSSPKASVAMTNQVNGDNPGADDPMMDMAEDAPSVLGNNPSYAQVLAGLQQFEAETQSFLLHTRALYTLDALNQLARYLSGLPGHKNLIWFSGSFPLNILPDGDLQNPFAVVDSAADEFRDTTDLLSRSQVAVYPIDARGLMVMPMLNAGSSGANYAQTPNSFGRDQAKFFQQTADEHGTMQQMAEATGGRAFVNTIGLREAVEKAIDAGSNYYTITYSPTNQKWNGDYRKIRVEVARPGITLAYRRGYFADDPKAPPRRGGPAAAGLAQAPPKSAMRTAMMRGGPDPTEIIFAVNIRPAVAEPEPDVAPGNKVAEKTAGPYRRYTVLFGIDAHDVDCAAAPDGARQCALAAEILVYAADGNLLNSAVGRMEANITADRYADMLKSGIHFQQDISVPVSGESFLRIGVHDESADKVGAVEIPTAAIREAPPLAPAAAPAAAPAPPAPK